MKVSGCVKEKGTKKPIKGTTITFTIDEEEWKIVPSVGDGKFFAKDDQNYQEKTITYRAEKAGFKTKEDKLTVQGGELEIDIELEKEQFEVEFEVKDEKGSPIQGATIVLKQNSKKVIDEEPITDKDGIVKIPFPSKFRNETIQSVINFEGYSTVAKDIVLKDGSTRHMVKMVPVAAAPTPPSPPPIQPFSWSEIAIAIAVLLFFAIGIWWFVRPKQDPPVAVMPVEIQSFKADSSVLEKGKSTSLRWETNAEKVEIIENGTKSFGKYKSSGEVIVTPNKSTKYELIAMIPDQKPDTESLTIEVKDKKRLDRSIITKNVTPIKPTIKTVKVPHKEFSSYYPVAEPSDGELKDLLYDTETFKLTSRKEKNKT